MTRLCSSIVVAALALTACDNTPGADDGSTASGGLSSDGGGGTASGGARASGGETNAGGDGPGGAANQCGGGTAQELCDQEGTDAVTRLAFGPSCEGLVYTAYGLEGRFLLRYYFDANGDFAATKTSLEAVSEMCPEDFYLETSGCQDDQACIFCARDAEFAATLELPDCE